MKKSLSLILSLVMVISAFAVLPFTANADATIDDISISYRAAVGDKIAFVPDVSKENFTVKSYWFSSDGDFNHSVSGNFSKSFYYTLYAELEAKSGYKFGRKSFKFNGAELYDYNTVNSNSDDAYEEINYMGNNALTTNADQTKLWFSISYYPVFVSATGTSPDKDKVDLYAFDFVSPGEEFDVEHDQLYADQHLTKWTASYVNTKGVTLALDVTDEDQMWGIIVAPSSAQRIDVFATLDTCTYKETVTKKPTCVAVGEKALVCTVCNRKKSNTASELPIDPNNHANLETIPAVAATFKAAGKTAGKKCKDCGKIVVAQKAVAKLGSPKLSKVVKAKKAFTAKWKKVNGIDGYQVRYSLKKNMKKSKTVNVKNTATSKKISKLKRKKTYYVQIRAYKTINGKKVYSAWSAKKTVKTK